MIKVLNYTQNPITFIGQCVGNCYGSDTTDSQKNYKRGKQCILDNHGRVMEYPDVTIEISDYSSRVIREIYTHVVGTTRTQESTRYINYKDFKYYTPKSIQQNELALEEYNDCMDFITKYYEKLLSLGIPKEDVANILPLGMNTRIVLKINVRALEHMFSIRTCNRAYIECRDLMKELKQVLNNLDDEWKWLCDNLFKTQCDKQGYCTESHDSCGRFPVK